MKSINKCKYKKCVKMMKVKPLLNLIHSALFFPKFHDNPIMTNMYI